ncbi:MAG: hypothetical protein J6Z00_00525, partial [Clostridia bacterium]|nr:hypothetical protein [Clostridia bacterium]
MKKVFSIVLGLALIIGLLSIVSTAAVAEDSDKGPNQSGYPYVSYFTYDSSTYYLYVREDYSSYLDAAPEGISYSKNTNTLTLKNAVYTDMYLKMYEMGSDFTINVIGDNHIGAIIVEGEGYTSSLTITGTGSLVINEEDIPLFTPAPLVVESKYTASALTVSPTVTLDVYPSYSSYPSIVVNETTSGNGLSLPKANKANLSKKTMDCPLVRRAYELWDDDMYLCTPKSGSNLSTSKTYVAYPAGPKKYLKGEIHAYVFTGDYFIYTAEKCDALNGYIVTPLTDSDGRPVSDTLFNIVEDEQHRVTTYHPEELRSVTVSKYNGSEAAYKNKEFYIQDWSSFYIKGSSDLYSINEIIAIPGYGYGIKPIGELTGISSIPNGFYDVYVSGKNLYNFNYTDEYHQKGTCLKKLDDGKYYYFKDGVKTKATLLFKHTDGKYYYVKNGVVTKSTLLFKHTDGKYYYVKNGVVTKSTLLFKHTDGKYYYVKNGVVTKSTLLFKHTDGKYYYVKNGVVTKSTLLFKHTDGKYYYVKNGVVTKSTLLFKHTDKKFY